MTTGTELINRFEKFANPRLAEKWDHVGLQVGNPDQPINRLMTTLDVRPETVDEAIQKKVDFIFAHHPIMFHPAKDLDTRNPQNKMYAKLLANNITVYAAHTNLDTANGGMNDWLADKLHLRKTSSLVPAGNDPLSNEPVGMGRVGELENGMSVQEFTDYCMNTFQVKGLRLIVNPLDKDKKINRVAVLGGSGQEFYQQAIENGADAYITGDVSYHFAHDMIANHLVVVDPGHHIEVIAAHKLAKLISQWQKENNWQFTVMESHVNTEPFTFMVK
ncbi:Nif3-like dinuclear metal center hexameric protein [Limosilactobacillus sp. STM2_1]|uniref:GTP cyclohydrolase 1 type 2 homolog n=1 Tax=Limosilactobacillus rudii TaxID=2759755 RepID=A0A7W3UK06_9LACO|nr:Nif3-like dinuclear metal center hexameric protein [Limosilactobacillus rudii]MBB1078325.1 Nif3-like dinuclear metal center hexameric protein [Limosilactobacillus rudii]MBB1096921.1 Nif3-like dinuclear metal center hexameric protein [Limosilactobacillus rudii]MCD7134079.1 Nif3-like dinuclear metal center hexameric protein [Limosilactobacillus rudii]